VTFISLHLLHLVDSDNGTQRYSPQGPEHKEVYGTGSSHGSGGFVYCWRWLAERGRSHDLTSSPSGEDGRHGCRCKPSSNFLVMASDGGVTRCFGVALPSCGHCFWRRCWIVEANGGVVCNYHIDDGESQRRGTVGLCDRRGVMDSHRVGALSDVLVALMAGLTRECGSMNMD
jgi:hypothetical protein